MPIAKVNLSENNVNAQIDLESLLGGMAKNPAVQEVFFQMALDKLNDRLDKGVGVNGKPLKDYSEEYTNSLAYNAFGKDGTVNMQLSGDMLASLNISNKDPKAFTISFSADESPKAFAHMTGYRGHPHLDGKVKPREFFGWTDKELKEIANKIKPNTNSEQTSTVTDVQILTLVERLLGG